MNTIEQFAIYAFATVIIITFAAYELTHPDSRLYEEKKPHTFFKRLQSTGALKIKQYYFKRLLLRVVTIKHPYTRKTLYIRKPIKGKKYFKLCSTIKAIK
jgi:hypothetical protein